jgi:hypothetical protein
VGGSGVEEVASKARGGSAVTSGVVVVVEPPPDTCSVSPPLLPLSPFDAST